MVNNFLINKKIIFIICALAIYVGCAPQDLKYDRIYNFVLGQEAVDSYEPVGYGAYQMITVGNKLIIADTYNNRVLIWNDKDQARGTTSADVVLGQPDLESVTHNNGGVSDKSLYRPKGLTSDGTRLFVSDSFNNRILIWDSIPTSNFEPADWVLGQTDFVSNTVNAGGIVSASGLDFPNQIFYAGGKLLVTDTYNNRVLIWTAAIASNNQAANLVIGQAVFTTRGASTSTTRLRSPQGVWTDGTKILISESQNHRIAVYNSFPVANGAAANFVLGQTLFTTRIENEGGISKSSLKSPGNVFSDGTMIAVAENSNHRVLVWNSWPTVNKQAANIVLGQPDETSVLPNQNSSISGSTLNFPASVLFNGDQFYVGDTGNKRILIYDQALLADSLSAESVLGHSGLTQSGVDMSSIGSSIKMLVHNNKLFVSDSNNNRVLIWNRVPKDNNVPADIVLGQPNGTEISSNNSGISNKSLSSPAGIHISESGKLIVADFINSRVLIWNTVPTVNYAPADVVLGQPDFSSSTANSGGSVSEFGLNLPSSITTAGDKLIVTDMYNHRILIWDSIPTTDFAPADLVLGQADFTTATLGTTQNTLQYPGEVWSDGTKIIAVDGSNHRVLIWNDWPDSNQKNADVVVGQVDFTTASTPPTDSTLYYPSGIWTDGKSLYVADRYNHRIMIWNSIPTSNGEPANKVFGQVDFISKANSGASNISYPSTIYKYKRHIFISDEYSRILAIHEKLF